MVALKDCSQEKDRMGCIEKNLALLNASFETVVKELRMRVGELEAAPAKLEGGALKSGDTVTLSSFDPNNGQNRGQCLTYIDHDRPANIQACGGGATQFQKWTLSK